MRLGLSLGAGGIVGASYLTGALEGIRRATGWVPSHAEAVVGTSAGAFIGALALTTSVPLLYGHCTEDEVPGVALTDEERDLATRLDRHNAGSFVRRYPPVRRLPRPFLCSPAAVSRALRAPRRTTPELFLTGLLPEGMLSTRSVGAIVEDASHGLWPTTPLYLAAVDLDAGRRVLFGKPDAPAVPLHEAVQASVAIPGVFAPVAIGGRRYCDGGMWSTTNLDALLEHELDAVLAIVPMGGGPSGRPGLRRALGDALALHRHRVDARTRRELAIFRERNVPAFVVHPTPDDLDALPRNFLSFASRSVVVAQAARSVAARLAEGGTLEALGRTLRRAADGGRGARGGASHT